MTPHYVDDHLTVWLGDTRAALEAMPADSVDCVITSPPYYSLRDYGLEPVVWGGALEHDHEWGPSIVATNEGWTGKDRWNHRVNGDGLEYEVVDDRRRPDQGAFCACGAWRGQLGLEPDPFLYVAHVVEVFRAIRRVLRPDGTAWLNLGDSYASKARGSDRGWDKSRLTNPGHSQKAQAASMRSTGERHRGTGAGFKNKDRMGIPHRVVFALQDDGWWWRDEIVWHKNNPMPSSVEDRTTPSHEMVFVLTKSARYRWDGDAIREGRPAHELAREARGYRQVDSVNHREDARPPGSAPQTGLRRASWPGGWDTEPGDHGTIHRKGRTSKRDKQSATAAAAVGSSSRTMPGFNDRWRAGQEQELKLRQNDALHSNLPARGLEGTRNKRSVWTVATEPYPDAHFATFPEKLIEPMILAGVPAGGVVLDPFGGSGTVAVVAQRLGRRAVLVDLSPEYVGQMIRRVAAARGAGEGPAIDMPVPFARDGLWAEEA